MKMVEQFKESKKIMMIKMEQASKLADAAADEFIDSIKSLVRDASDEEFKEILNTKDEMIDFDDKMAIIVAYAESHEDVGGVAIINIGG